MNAMQSLNKMILHVVGSAPDHCNKANMALKQVMNFFGFLVHIKAMFSVLCKQLFKCAIAFSLKSNVHIFI